MLNYLTSLSDYPDSVFDYQVNEAKITKLIKEAYKGLSVQQAINPFLSTYGDQRAQNSRKLSQKLMKEFSATFKDNFKELSTN